MLNHSRYTCCRANGAFRETLMQSTIKPIQMAESFRP